MNQRPTMALLSCSFDIGVSPFERLIGKGNLASTSHLGIYSHVQTAALRILLSISKGWFGLMVPFTMLLSFEI